MPDIHDLIEESLAFGDSAPRTRDQYVRAPFAYPGGKFDSLEFILPRIPKGKIFVETCGGSGVLTMNVIGQFDLRVFNDRYAGVTAFYRVLKDAAKRAKMLEWLRNSIHSREEFLWCRDSWKNCQDDVERAARWYYMNRMSFGSLGRNWARATSGRSQHGASFHNGLDKFGTIFPYWKEVQVENLDAIQCIKDFDSEETVFYVDPDYIGTDPGIYENKVRHVELLDTIFASKGYFIVSNYHNDVYACRPWERVHSWEIQSTIRPKAFTENNNLVGKEIVMSNEPVTVREMLYIKEWS